MLSSIFTWKSLWTILIGFIPFLIAVFNKKNFPKNRLRKMFKWNAIISLGYWILGFLPFIGSLFGIAWVFLLLWSLFPKWAIFKWLN